MVKLISAYLIASLLVSCAAEVKKEAPENIPEPQLMESPVDSVSAEPYLFTDKNGVVYLSWETTRARNSTLNYSTLKNGKWSEPSVIASGNNWFVN